MPEVAETTEPEAVLPLEQRSAKAVFDAIDEALASTAPELKRLRPEDFDKLLLFARQAYRINELWDHASLANPGQWFLTHYSNPINLVLDVCEGEGVIAFLKTLPGWRAQVYAAAWGRPAMRRSRQLLPIACRIAMMAWELLAVDAFVREDNTLSRRACAGAGMRYTGLSKYALYYIPGGHPMHVFEFSRRDLGLPDIEV